MMMRRIGVAAAILLSGATCPAADGPGYARVEDVIYGRKHGVALTMDVFTPSKDANGLGIVMVVSGGWYSAHEAIQPGFIKPLLDHGYTVFTVVHGSQPQYTIPEIIGDMKRSIRFIRHNAKKYGVDPDRLGITGASAGGHLSLMIGTAGEPPRPGAVDPVDAESSRVAAVACFFPPTDLANYGGPGKGMFDAKDFGKPFRPAFEYKALNPETNLWEFVTDPEKRKAIALEISPITHVSPDDPPTLIIHGDADTLVPIQQGRVMVDALKAAGIDATLTTKPGAKHGWLTMGLDIEAMAAWFDAHLKAPASAKATATP